MPSAVVYLQGIHLYDSEIKTGNLVLDTIFTSKSTQCVRLGIKMTVVADGKLLNQIHVMDLCTIFGNALDNAIDGTKDIEGAKKIEISMGVKQGNFLLKVKNTFNPELIKFDNNGKRLRTSKTDKSNHGMGIGLIEETALKYNGLMEITMNENIFCLSVLLYQN